MNYGMKHNACYRLLKQIIQLTWNVVHIILANTTLINNLVDSIWGTVSAPAYPLAKHIQPRWIESLSNPLELMSLY